MEPSQSLEGVHRPKSFANTVEGIAELANETSAGERGRLVAFGLFLADDRDDVCVEEGSDEIHLLDL